MSARRLGVDRGGHVHPWDRPHGSAGKVKPQVTTQIAHSRVRGGSVPGVDMSTPVHPKSGEPQPPARAAHDTARNPATDEPEEGE